jgi:hypothetical protein
MSNEPIAFSERLRAALQRVGVGESPAELVRLLARFGGEPVSQQAVSGWLKGRAMPRQANLRALAKMLSVEPQQLQYGDDGKRVEETRGEWHLDPRDQLAIPSSPNSTTTPKPSKRSSPPRSPVSSTTSHSGYVTNATSRPPSTPCSPH